MNFQFCRAVVFVLGLLFHDPARGAETSTKPSQVTKPLKLALINVGLQEIEFPREAGFSRVFKGIIEFVGSSQLMAISNFGRELGSGDPKKTTKESRLQSDLAEIQKSQEIDAALVFEPSSEVPAYLLFPPDWKKKQIAVTGPRELLLNPKILANSLGILPVVSATLSPLVFEVVSHFPIERSSLQGLVMETGSYNAFFGSPRAGSASHFAACEKSSPKKFKCRSVFSKNSTAPQIGQSFWSPSL